MQLVSLEKARTPALFWAVVGFTLAVILYTRKQDDPLIFATGLILAIASLYPFYFWLMGWSHGLPIWPLFCMVNGVSAALPLVQKSVAIQSYTPEEIITGSLTLIGFFVLATSIWLAITGQPPRPPKKLQMVGAKDANRYLFSFILLGIFFLMNSLFAWVVLPGNTMQIARGISLSLNTLGIFVLAFYSGRGLLSKAEDIWLVVLAASTAIFAAAGLLLVSAFIPLAMLGFGYAFGSGKIPWKTVIIVLLCAAVLHPGKFPMRSQVWSGDWGRLTLFNLPQFYADWVSYGIQSLGLSQPEFGKAQDEELEEVSSLFERGGTIHMLLLVQKMSPKEVPFLNGLTYEPIPRLLVPRFIDDQKGVVHAGNMLLSINYGLQTTDDVRGTSIGWGLIPEAYANFGYLGVAGLAVFLAIFYGFFTNLTVGVPMTSLRFVMGLLIMGAATTADTMGVFLTSQFQGIVSVTLASFFLMRRQPNPLIEDEEFEKTRHQHLKNANGSQAENVSGNFEKGAKQATGSGRNVVGEQAVMQGAVLAADGGVVRNFATRIPQRAAVWMPRRMRRHFAAQLAAASNGAGDEPKPEDEETKSAESASARPRQLAVPYRNYRRYRG